MPKTFARRNWSAVTVVRVVTGLSIALLLLRFMLLSVPEIYPFGAELGDLVSDASLAILTAALFQFLVVTRPNRAKQQASNRLIAPRVLDLARPAWSLLRNLSLTSRIEFEGGIPDRETFGKMCAQIDTSKSPRNFAARNWWVFLTYIQRRRVEAQLRLEPYYDRMDETLLGMINRERAAGLMLAQFSTTLPLPTNSDLSTFADSLWAWIQAENELYIHANTVLYPGLEDNPHT